MDISYHMICKIRIPFQSMSLAVELATWNVTRHTSTKSVTNESSRIFALVMYKKYPTQASRRLSSEPTIDNYRFP